MRTKSHNQTKRRQLLPRLHRQLRHRNRNAQKRMRNTNQTSRQRRHPKTKKMKHEKWKKLKNLNKRCNHVQRILNKHYTLTIKKIQKAIPEDHDVKTFIAENHIQIRDEQANWINISILQNDPKVEFHNARLLRSGKIAKQMLLNMKEDITMYLRQQFPRLQNLIWKGLPEIIIHVEGEKRKFTLDYDTDLKLERPYKSIENLNACGGY